jgi:phenylpyruvate tautomerase PptA (4-oxalocrotonate tautomerase family)
LKRTLAIVLGPGLGFALLAAACGGDDDDAASTPSDDEILTAVTQALIAKNGWDPADVRITLQSVEDGRYAMGGVAVVPGPGGGLWFAALMDGGWRIVWDGNGSIGCDALEPYPDFPASMIPACYEMPDGKLRTR